MDTIDRVTLDRAAQHVTRINLKGVEIHTVLIVLNGQHGGADVHIKGSINNEDDILVDYDETVEVH